MRKIFLQDEFNKIWKRIEKKENITLFRYGDGERSLMIGKPVLAQEGWTAPSEITELGKALLDTLNLDDENVYYGISCPCCDSAAYYWYETHIKSKNKTFANLFVNKNYSLFISKFEALERDVIVIGNHAGKNNKIGSLNVLKYYSIGDQCVNFYRQEIPSLLDEIKKDFGDRDNLLYVVSAGPLSEPIIHDLYKNNKNNSYIDFGSSIDCYIHHRDTRPYTNKNSVFGRRNCWMYDPKTTSFDVTCVLNMYKRPESIVKQFDALSKQTLKPKSVILYQDGISKNYSINLNDDFTYKFDEYKKAAENTGVWQRFIFAREKVKTPYVCVFDDDTIPGDRWLENCHSQMMEQEGIYGTNCIMMTNDHSYPLGGHFSLGWKGPVSKRFEVDFVGHSWFFPKKCLDYMLEGTEKFQNMKYVGEDMCISFKSKEHGVKTFVPPHPANNLSFWGSLPKYGYKIGTSMEALSVNFNNLQKMQDAIKSFKDDGWRPVCFDNPLLPKLAMLDSKKQCIKMFFIRVKRFMKNRLGR